MKKHKEPSEQAKRLAAELENEILGTGLRLSPPLKVGDKEVILCQIPDHRKQLLRIEAMGWVESMRRRVEQKIGGNDIRDADVDWEEIRGARWNTTIVQAATRRADDPDKHAFTMRELEIGGDSNLIGFIAAKYFDFERAVDIDQVDAELVYEVIELLKKKAIRLQDLWPQFGFATLSHCLLTMADRLERLETELSSLTSSTSE